MQPATLTSRLIDLAPHLEKAGYRRLHPRPPRLGQSEEPHNAATPSKIQAQLVVGFSIRRTPSIVRSSRLVQWRLDRPRSRPVDHRRASQPPDIMDMCSLRIAPTVGHSALYRPLRLRNSTPRRHAHAHPLAVPKFVATDMPAISQPLRVGHQASPKPSMMTAKDVMDDDLPTLRMPVLIHVG